MPKATNNVPATVPQLGAVTRFEATPEMIEWDDSSELPACNANQVVVMNTGDQFHLCFYESIPPVMTDPKRMSAAKKVRAKGLARVVISPKLAQQLVGALAQHFNGVG